VIAILGGLGAAFCWATTLIGSSRSARLIGAWSTLAWVMTVGFVVTLPFLLVTGGSVQLGPNEFLWMGVSGVANVAGLLIGYTALRAGKIAVVGPIVSTEGAIAALISVAAGEPIQAAAAICLALIAAGVAMAASERSAPQTTAGLPRRTALVTALIALAAAVCFGLNLFAAGRIAAILPIAWAIMPARAAGVIGVALPLILRGRLQITRAAAPWAIVVGLAEVLGTASYALGSRDGIAAASVIASQFAAIAAIAAFLFFGERLSRIQVVGVVTIALGVGALSYLSA
jgi:uncharacterized membrane protein